MFKIGDKVRIKNFLSQIEDFNGGFLPEMEKEIGKETIITELLDGGYILQDSEWLWDEHALEAINDNSKQSENNSFNWASFYELQQKICQYNLAKQLPYPPSYSNNN